MPRKLRDERLDSRTARLKLVPRGEPYWRSIQEGRAIGYRRLPRGRAGTWIARDYDPARTPKRLQKSLGNADDLLDADEVATLTFAQVQEAALAWFSTLTQSESGRPAPISVAAAMKNYVEDYITRGGKDLQRIETTIRAHILPHLGNVMLNDLSAAMIKRWHHALARQAPRVRSRGGSQNTRDIDHDDPEALRRRRASANRILTCLRAGLSLAYQTGHAESDEAWKRVRPFRDVDAPRVRFLSDMESQRLVDRTDSAFRPMVAGAIHTGCRYGELTRLCVRDIDFDRGSLHVRLSKTNKPRDVILTEEAVGFFKQASAGKAPTDLVFTHPSGRAWGRSEQARPVKDACRKAEITPAISFHILRHTYASRLARRGIPLSVIAAQIGDSQTTCARYYAHLCPVFAGDMIRSSLGTLDLTSTEVQANT